MINLVDQLPQASRFAQAVSNDPEHVAAILAATEGQPEADTSPSVSEWDTQADLLAQVVDGLSHVVAVLIAANGGKPGEMKPVQRPRTKFAEVREQRTVSKHTTLAKKLLNRQPQVE